MTRDEILKQGILSALATLRYEARDVDIQLMQDIGSVIYANTRDSPMTAEFREKNPDRIATMVFNEIHEACDTLEPYLQGEPTAAKRGARLLGAALGAIYMAAHAGALDIFVNDYCAPFMNAFEEWRKANEAGAIERPRLFDINGKKVFTATDNINAEPRKAPLQFPSIMAKPEDKCSSD